jgi:hypothetical protein
MPCQAWLLYPTGPTAGMTHARHVSHCYSAPLWPFSLCPLVTVATWPHSLAWALHRPTALRGTAAQAASCAVSQPAPNDDPPPTTPIPTAVLFLQQLRPVGGLQGGPCCASLSASPGDEPGALPAVKGSLPGRTVGRSVDDRRLSTVGGRRLVRRDSSATGYPCLERPPVCGALVEETRPACPG